VARRCDDTVDKKRVNSSVLKHLFLKRVEQPKISPKKHGNALSDALLMSCFQKFAADAANGATFVVCSPPSRSRRPRLGVCQRKRFSQKRFRLRFTRSAPLFSLCLSLCCAVSRSHTDSLSLHDYETHTNTKEDVGSSEEEFRDEEEEQERAKDGVSEEDILSQVGLFQVPQHHEIIPLSILGCDQQNMEKILCDFKWAGHRLAHKFADGWSTGSHKREMTLLEAPTGTLLFYYEDLKQ